MSNSNVEGHEFLPRVKFLGGFHVGVPRGKKSWFIKKNRHAGHEPTRFFFS